MIRAKSRPWTRTCIKSTPIRHAEDNAKRLNHILCRCDMLCYVKCLIRSVWMSRKCERCDKGKRFLIHLCLVWQPPIILSINSLSAPSLPFHTVLKKRTGSSRIESSRFVLRHIRFTRYPQHCLLSLPLHDEVANVRSAYASCSRFPI